VKLFAGKQSKSSSIWLSIVPTLLSSYSESIAVVVNGHSCYQHLLSSPKKTNKLSYSSQYLIKMHIFNTKLSFIIYSKETWHLICWKKQHTPLKWPNLCQNRNFFNGRGLKWRLPGSCGDCQAHVETAGSCGDCQGSSGDCQCPTPGWRRRSSYWLNIKIAQVKSLFTIFFFYQNVPDNFFLSKSRPIKQIQWFFQSS
jgi:hypothetical protein